VWIEQLTVNVWAEIQLEELDEREESIGDLGCHTAMHNVVSGMQFNCYWLEQVANRCVVQ